jgi:hypothetical protein
MLPFFSLYRKLQYSSVVDKLLWKLEQVRLKDECVLVSGIPQNPRKSEAWKNKGINPSESAESGRQAGMRSKSAPESAKSGRQAGMRSKSAPESAKSGRQAGMRGKSAPESAKSGREAGIRGKSAPDFTGSCPKQSSQNRAV